MKSSHAIQFVRVLSIVLFLVFTALSSFTIRAEGFFVDGIAYYIN